MRRFLRYLFYGITVLYVVYNVFWLTGSIFSFGRNDTYKELIYFFITFVVDVPVFFWIAKRPAIGVTAFLFALLVGMSLAASLEILNKHSLLYWYIPKLAPLVTALLSGDSVSVHRVQRGNHAPQGK